MTPQCPDFCRILVARHVSPGCPDLCHLGAQTCATLVPMPSWESIDRGRDAAGTVIRPPRLCSAGQRGSRRFLPEENRAPRSERIFRQTQNRSPKSPAREPGSGPKVQERPLWGIMPFINEMNITIQCESHKIHIEYRGRASFNIHYSDRSPKSPVPGDV